MTLKPRHSPSNRGTTLLEILMAMGILGTLIITSLAALDFLNRRQTRRANQRGQNALARHVQGMLESPQNLIYSIEHNRTNPRLAQCALGYQDHCRGAMDPENPVPFVLYRANPANPGEFTPLTSIDNQRVRYNRRGEICDPHDPQEKDKDCVYEVLTYFYGSCQISKDYCAQDFLTQTILDQNNILSPPLEAKDPYCERGSEAQRGGCEYGAHQIHIMAKINLLPVAIGTHANIQRHQQHTRLGKINYQLSRYISYSTPQIFGSRKSTHCGRGLEHTAGGYDDPGFSVVGTFASLTGFDPNGDPRCECSYPFRAVFDSMTGEPLYQTEADNPHGRGFPLCGLLAEDELACGKGQGLYYDKVEFQNDTSDPARPHYANQVVCKSAAESFSCEDVHTHPQHCYTNTTDPSRVLWITRYARNDCYLECTYDASSDKGLLCGGTWSDAGLRQFVPYTDKHPLASNAELTHSSTIGGSSHFTCSTVSTYCCRPNRGHSWDNL